MSNPTTAPKSTVLPIAEADRRSFNADLADRLSPTMRLALVAVANLEAEHRRSTGRYLEPGRAASTLARLTGLPIAAATLQGLARHDLAENIARTGAAAYRLTPRGANLARYIRNHAA